MSEITYKGHELTYIKSVPVPTGICGKNYVIYRYNLRVPLGDGFTNNCVYSVKLITQALFELCIDLGVDLTDYRPEWERELPALILASWGPRRMKTEDLDVIFTDVEGNRILDYGTMRLVVRPQIPRLSGRWYEIIDYGQSSVRTVSRWLPGDQHLVIEGFFKLWVDLGSDFQQFNLEGFRNLVLRSWENK